MLPVVFLAGMTANLFKRHHAGRMLNKIDTSVDSDPLEGARRIERIPDTREAAGDGSCPASACPGEVASGADPRDFRQAIAS